MAALPNQAGNLGQFDSSAMSNTSIPAIIMSIGETFIPGLGFANSIASTYFQIDLTYYIIILCGTLAIFTGLSYVADLAWRYVSPYIMCTAEIRYDDEVYNYLMYWVTKQKFSTTTTRFVASIRTSSAHVWTGEDDEDSMDHEDKDLDDQSNENSNWDKMKTVKFTPSEGVHRFWYRGRPFTFTRYKNENQGLWSSSFAETIFISTFGRNPTIIKSLLQEAQIQYHERDGGKTVIYRGMKPPGGSSDELEWMRCLSRPPRPMSTVVLDDSQKNEIVSDMREYLHTYTRKWYSNRGLPYRRGYLFHGPPGTGKTSLCFALAGLLNLRIYVVSLNSKAVTEDSLAKLFSDLPWRCIILLEDIDSAGITAKRTEIKEEAELTKPSAKEEAKGTATAGGENSTNPRGITLSAFLNIIDGVASSEGRILVMTTNHIEKLDPAILRPGRVDVTIRFKFADQEMSRGIFKAIYANSEEQLPRKSDNNADTNTNTKVGKDFVHINGHVRSNSELSSKPTEQALDNKTPAPPSSPSWYKFKQHNKTAEEIEALASEFAAGIPADEFTPAEIQGFLLRHKHNPQLAVDEVEKFIQTLRAEKEVQKKGIVSS